eukprot:PhM_4_TR16126/c1_g4_i3/m.101250
MHPYVVRRAHGRRGVRPATTHVETAAGADRLGDRGPLPPTPAGSISSPLAHTYIHQLIYPASHTFDVPIIIRVIYITVCVSHIVVHANAHTNVVRVVENTKVRHTYANPTTGDRAPRPEGSHHQDTH